jgi:SAM-dependent methyltransferase
MGLVDENEALTDAFGRAAPEHFEWQTQGLVVSEHERELVRRAFLPLGERVLDLGCGEGATLVHLGEPAGAHGVDLFAEKIAFARQRLPHCHFSQASVYELPFEDAAFDQLLVRDLIHHLEEPERFIDECARVLAPGGRLDVLEPCGYNPLIFLHAVTNRAERGELRSNLPFLTKLVTPRFDVSESETLQALPLHRIVYHPKLGNPKLAGVALVRRLVDRAERLAEGLMPKAARAYLRLRAQRR